MSLEKVDIRCKFDVETIAYVNAEAKARGTDKCDILREILDAWRDIQKRKYIALQNELRSQGLAGADQGTSGQTGASQEKQPLSWDEE